ncbi:Tox-REase-5 domain-containing protein [Pyxidicoccus xibeiensis]|uniref:Tox-REase-5 domain-containing protein n=1 Tax=Pyxidicoccus xibeiensis TaxID=2906759 RepID=UPI0020A7AFB7|nr:Tox-REase-5 domain-containing protein [Pyxidicoccus xibeiensis]MCP3142838.1 restriction endonuclease fold toxin 5 domain-containing protein [Pyxidicoccus xibeiensis]
MHDLESRSTPSRAVISAFLVVLIVLGGCGTGGPLPLDDPYSWHLRKGLLFNSHFLHGLPAENAQRGELGPIRSSRLDVDGFQGLLVRAGVPPSRLPGNGRKLTPELAAHLLTSLLETDVPLRDWGPRRMAAHLLVQVVQERRTVTRDTLHERMRRYVGALVLRPDGHLVRATTGEAIQFAGEVELSEGALRAEGFEVGPFYGTRGDRYLYRLEDDLGHHPDARVAGSFMPDTGTVGPAVEGLGRAVLDVVDGVVTLVMQPGESLAGLAKLPAAVRTLIEHSPEYWERYRALPHGEQVRQASRLLTNVLLTCGTAGAGSVRLASVGSRLGQLGVPVLSLAADGALALRTVVVPAGQVVAVAGQGASALYVLHMANQGAGGASGSSHAKPPWPPPPRGPGQWVRKNEGMKPPARRYQEQITGAPEGWVYRVRTGDGPMDYVDFDGFDGGSLLEVKGPNLAKFIDGDLEALWFFEGSDNMLVQAGRQIEAAGGIPVRWVVAEKRFADYLRKFFEANGRGGIEVVHVPARP